ncbi:MAG: hypothetical protein A3J40_11810 [Erythrobacter sp. RIFCSPHIGHO2_12_FULL_63_10]|nr:MAG: hypothetical protein A3J40_11810 [Erythrobacter sp. RIFCSPHIGHO2_12_FULL_63_10]
MAWGHATSTDLARWDEHAPALLEDESHMVFSGSAVIDRANTGGFGRDAMIAIHTASMRGEQPRQTQWLAISRDYGASWKRFAGNPVLDLGLADFRDPCVFWHEDTRRWVMVVALSVENAAGIFISTDLRNWHETGRIEGESAPGNLWECPALIELPVAGTNRTHWLFKVDALNDAPASGALYQTGTFDGECFIPDVSEWQILDQGMDFYAAIPWNGPNDAKGRPCWIGWMGNHRYQHDFPTRGWRGVMSLPRRLELVLHESGLRLAQSIEPTVTQLFDAARPVAAGQSTVPIACRIDLASGFSGMLQIEDGPSTAISVERQDGEILIRRVDEELPFLSFEREIALPRRQGLSLYVDSETCEILSSDGTVAVSLQHRPQHARLALHTDDPAKVSVAPLGKRTAT